MMENLFVNVFSLTVCDVILKEQKDMMKDYLVSFQSYEYGEVV